MTESGLTPTRVFRYGGDRDRFGEAQFAVRVPPELVGAALKLPGEGELRGGEGSEPAGEFGRLGRVERVRHEESSKSGCNGRGGAL